MEKLKTLGDMQLCNQDEFKRGLGVEINRLKQEVIKWIKELKYIGEHNCKEKHPFYFFRHDTAPVIDFLKDRFNLTDEDFKNG